MSAVKAVARSLQQGPVDVSMNGKECTKLSQKKNAPSVIRHFTLKEVLDGTSHLYLKSLVAVTVNLSSSLNRTKAMVFFMIPFSTQFTKLATK